MTDQQIKILIGIIAFLSLFIRLPKVEIKLWQYLLKGIGDAINGSLKAQIADLSKQITEVDKLLNDHINTQNEAEITNCRRRILRFDDEVRRGEKHGQEHWNNVIEDVDNYQQYCDQHEDYHNSKAEKAMQHLKDTYNKLTLQDFL